MTDPLTQDTPTLTMAERHARRSHATTGFEHFAEQASIIREELDRRNGSWTDRTKPRISGFLNERVGGL